MQLTVIPCPFCGEQFHYTRGPRQTRGPVNHMRNADKTRKAIAGAVESWNRRALPLTC